MDIASSSSLRSRPNAAIFGTAALLLVLLVLLVVPALVAPQESLRDDSYSYPQIAANIVAGNGSTFHGLTPTNGYHPLWMAIALALSFLKLMRGPTGGRR